MRREKKNQDRGGQPPRFEERVREDDPGTGAEVRGYGEISRDREEPYQQRGQQRPHWDNDLMPRDPDPKGDDVPKDHDRGYGWSGGYGEERNAREAELTEQDADAARDGETHEDPGDEAREGNNTPEDPDVGETGRERPKAY